MRWFLWILACTAMATSAWAQAPSTDIHIMSISRDDDGSVTFGPPRNASDHAGYDNQPAFVPGQDAFLFTSLRMGEQTEVFRCDLASSAVTRVTDTPESEYSPTPLASGGFSTVRVETDSLATQRLWEFDGGGHDPTLVLPEVRGVGYHAWANEHELILFVLGEPHELHRADRRTGTSTVVAKDIGRALHRIPGENAMSFTQPIDDEHWMIRKLDVGTGEITDLAAAPAGTQDLTWTPWGELWMTRGSHILAWRESSWIELVDLGPAGFTEMTRLAVSPDARWLAVVAAEPAPSTD